MLRPLLLSDYYLGYLNLLKQLSKVKQNISFNDFKSKWFEISNNKNHKIYVFRKDNKIVGSGTILFESKFIRNFEYAAHIEDIVVLEEYRGKGIASLIINKLKEEAFNKKCYRVTLNCQLNKKEFYEKFNFELKSNCMRIDISTPFNKKIYNI